MYGSDRQVPESAQTATAVFGGVKINFNVVALKDSVRVSDCNAQSSQGKAAEVQSIIRHAIDQGTNAWSHNMYMCSIFISLCVNYMLERSETGRGCFETICTV